MKPTMRPDVALRAAQPNALKSHPVASFLALSLVITWGLCGLSHIVRMWTGLPAWAYVLAESRLAFVAPSLTGIFMAHAVAGVSGLRDLVYRASLWRVELRWYLAALLLPGIVLLAAVGICLLAGRPMSQSSVLGSHLHMFPVMLLAVLLGDAMGEEWGWRGFALPRLQERHGPLAASIVIGMTWTLWYLPTLAPSGVGQVTASHLLGMGIMTLLAYEVAISIMMTWLYNKTGGSLFVAGFFSRATVTTWMTCVLTISAEQPGLLDSTLVFLGAAMFLLLAAVLVVMTRGQLGHASGHLDRL